MTTLRRTLAMAALFPLLAGAAMAQEVAPPETPEAMSGGAAEPVAPQGVPEIGTAMPPNPNDLLTGLYATRATALACDIEIESAVQEAMAADEARFIDQLGLTGDAAQAAYQEIETAVEDGSVDCTEGSPDIAGVNEVLGLYAGR